MKHYLKRARYLLKSDRRLLLCSVGVLLFLGCGWYIFASATTPKLSDTRTVMRTVDGFVPNELTIRLGDTVTFQSTAGKPFWPASNLHPTHTIYPAFDPKRPIEAGASWSFTFNQAGNWEFHDHLAPTMLGVIHVLDTEGNEISTNCSDTGADSAAKQQCWEKLIVATTKQKGINAAFKELTTLYETEPSFAEACHSYTHLIGQEAYEEYAAGTLGPLPTSVSLCGYGFFHGFLEDLLASTGSLEQAKKFCTYVDAQLSGQRSSGALYACFHGWGHGVTDGSDPRAWGDPQAMINPSLTICTKLASNDFELSRCATGVFNALEILSQDATYKLDMLGKDPYAFCQTQKQIYREPCYTNMIPAVLRITNNDFTKAAAYVLGHIARPNEETQIDGTVQDVAILSLFHEYIRVHLADSDYAVTSGVAICRALPAVAKRPCIEGLSGGHFKYGPPGKEYVKGFAFCNSTLLSTDEKDACFGYILPRLPIWYSPQALPNLCSKVPEPYASKYCHAAEKAKP